MAHVLASSTHRAFILGESMFQKGFRSLWFFTCIFCILSQFRMPRCLPFDGLPFNLYELICASSLLIKVFWLDQRAKSQNSHHVQIWNSGTRMPHLSWSRHTKVWESWSSSTKTALFSIKLYTQIKGKNENKKVEPESACLPKNRTTKGKMSSKNSRIDGWRTSPSGLMCHPVAVASWRRSCHVWHLSSWPCFAVSPPNQLPVWFSEVP